MAEDLDDGLRVGEERDEREGCLAGWTDQREDFKGVVRAPEFCGAGGDSSRGGMRRDQREASALVAESMGQPHRRLSGR